MKFPTRIFKVKKKTVCPYKKGFHFQEAFVFKAVGLF